MTAPVIAAGHGLEVVLDWGPPSSLPEGRGVAMFCLGRCFHLDEPVDDVALVVDGVRHAPSAVGMPRPDVFRARDPAVDPLGHSLPSAFWTIIPLLARRPGPIRVELAARLSDGRELSAPIASIEVLTPEPPPPLTARPETDGPGLVAVCMATYEPDPDLFRVQVDSLRAQTDRRWICLVSDDASCPERFEQVREIIGGDPRFSLSRAEERGGHYHNFERALGMVPLEAELVALCDQDDRWYPDKLESLRRGLGDALLVYSDQRLVDDRGRVVRPTMWKGRRNNFDNLASMLIANTITGAAALFRRELAELALPFPQGPGVQFHDHWLGFAALAAGDVAYVDRPLYDYVQHSAAVFGEVARPAAEESGPLPPARPTPSARALALVARSRSAYFSGYLLRAVQAQTALVRFPERLTPSKRRTLERFLACGKSPLAWCWLALRPLRELAGRNETLGTEAGLAGGILWKALIAARARRGPRSLRLRGDATAPDPGEYQQKRLRRWRARV